jgi:hypothetical protein
MNTWGYAAEHGLYHGHLTASTEWGTKWDTISKSIHDTINKHAEKKYKCTHKKL